MTCCVRAGPDSLPHWGWVHQVYQIDTAEKEGPCEPRTALARFVSRDFIFYVS